MIRREIVEKSALRVLEKSTQGGIKKGEIGVFASRHGVGKTACLVHLAIDQLLQGKYVIHISFSDKPTHIIDWYDDIFSTLGRTTGLEHAQSLHDELAKKRVIMHFSPRSNMDHAYQALEALVKNTEFSSDMVIFDGYDFEHGETDLFLKELRSLANKIGAMVWISASYHREENYAIETTLPHYLQSIYDKVDILIFLIPDKDCVHLRLIKDHDLLHPEMVPLVLDSETLLIKEK